MHSIVCGGFVRPLISLIWVNAIDHPLTNNSQEINGQGRSICQVDQLMSWSVAINFHGFVF